MLAWQHELEAAGMYADMYVGQCTELDKMFQQATTPKPQWLLDSQPDTLVLFPIMINKQNALYINNMLHSKLSDHNSGRMLMMFWLQLPNIIGASRFKHSIELIDRSR
jgi:hypothetical protein